MDPISHGAQQVKLILYVFNVKNKLIVQQWTKSIAHVKRYTYSAASSPRMIRILFLWYQTDNISYKWLFRNTYLRSLQILYGTNDELKIFSFIYSHMDLNLSIIVKWNDNPKMYYDYCTGENLHRYCFITKNDQTVLFITPNRQYLIQMINYKVFPSFILMWITKPQYNCKIKW